MIVGKTYSWGPKGFISFRDTHLATTWGRGTYEKKDNTVCATWNNHSHILVFSNDFTKYTSIRTSPNDLDVTTGDIYKDLDYNSLNTLSSTYSILIDKYKNHLIKSYEMAENMKSSITSDIIKMDGMSGTKTRHFYNNLLSLDDSRYLEIGTWKGSSVCSAMCGNSASVVCIDNWSQFNGPKNDFLNNFNAFKGANNAKYIEADCYNVDVSELPKFNIYMYDGEHSAENHYKALIHYYDSLDDVFIFVVDDWNLDKVRDGTMASIKKLQLNILFEKEIILSKNGAITNDTQGWWNGIYFVILQKTRAKMVEDIS